MNIHVPGLIHLLHRLAAALDPPQNGFGWNAIWPLPLCEWLSTRDISSSLIDGTLISPISKSVRVKVHTNQDISPLIISTAETKGNRRSNIGSNCPKLQSFSPPSLKLTLGVPKACDTNITLTAAPIAMAALMTQPRTWIVFNHGRSLTCRYQNPSTNMMQFPEITAIVPTTESVAFDAAPLDSTCQTQAIGSVCGRSLNVLIKRNIPPIQLNTKLTNMKNWRIHLNTQSLLKSWTNANNVPICVAVERSDNTQMMKKWYGTMNSIFANPTHWIPIPVITCWSEKERSNFRITFDSWDERLNSRKINTLERTRESPAVMMNDKRTYSRCQILGRHRNQGY